MSSGVKTTEFWVTAFVILGTVLDSLKGNLSSEWAAVAGSIAAGAYAVSRAIAKRGATTTVTAGQTATVITPPAEPQ